MRNRTRGGQFRWLSAAGALLLFFGIACFLRFSDLDWDADAHLHPDERYLTMVVSTVRFPGEVPGQSGAPLCDSLTTCLRVYWNTDVSPLNPTNYEQYAGYVYGTLPLFSTRAVARWVDGACTGKGTRAQGLAAGWLLGSDVPSCSPGFFTGYGGIHLVGRALSGLADLATMAGLVLLAGLLYGRWSAVVAGGLYAFAVLPIQHAHFFVVDSFATVFVVWTLFFCVLSLRSRRIWLLLPAGVLTGLAIASKVSVWPLAFMVGLAGVVRPIEGGGGLEGTSDGNSPQWGLAISPQGLLALVAAGILCAVAFRSAQPYAFSGPTFFGVKINPDWLATMKDIQQLMQGLRDVPYGDQWTARTPIVFPWRNMVIWGLGIPLGLAAWAGWAAMAWNILRKRDFWHLIPWVWGTVFFTYQATQWVKSMRYLLPVYPVFVLFAAWLVTQAIRPLAEETETRHLTRWWRRVRRLRGGLSVVLPAGLLLGTAAWAWAFTAIYRQPVTRIQASQWMYENISTAVTLETDSGGTLNVPVKPDSLLSPENGVTSVQLQKVPSNVSVTAVTLPKVDPLALAGPRTFSATLFNHSAKATVTLGAAGPNRVRLAFDEPVAVTTGQAPVLSLSLLDGEPVTLKTSVVANEHWDDGLPLRLDGNDPYWDWYQGLQTSPSGQMNNYDDDTPEKRLNLLTWLDEADYIVLSSNRLYASIPRLPKRYPLTTEYYRQLLSGNLGFHLAAEFVSFPELAGCQFPDQEIPFSLATPELTNARACTIDLPAAEEAYSVYDHPTVLIFAKSDDFSRARAEELLPGSLLQDVQWMTPREATLGAGQNPNSFLMSPQMREAQESGGTWRDLFSWRALQNRFQWLAVLLWALMLTSLGWIAFPLLYAVLPNLRYRGYGLARVLGLLIWAYLAWLLASLKLLPYTRTTLWLLFAVLTALALWLGYRRREELWAFVSQRWRSLLTIDAIFVGLYLLWVGVRWLNPDLWHPVSGGEKPMDFAYLNAVIKSTWFPPYDPWFAGGHLNYYYFGFVMIASLVKALGIVPSIAYNLAIPTLFALTGVGAYTLANNLAGGDDHRGRRAGLWGVALVLLLGNLGEVRLILSGLTEVGNIHFDSLIPGYPQAVSAIVGVWKVLVQGVPLPFRRESWYWDATRIIPLAPGEAAGPINEFPIFTFLYADLHAHAMALPLTQTALAIALQWGLGFKGHSEKDNRRDQRDQSQRAHLWLVLRKGLPVPLGSLLLAGLVAGALKATNTWDYPTYLALMTVGFFIGLVSYLYQHRERDATFSRTYVQGDPRIALESEGTQRFDDISTVIDNTGVEQTDQISPAWQLLAGCLTPLLLLVFAELLFRPFTANYQSAYAALQPWTGSRTPLKIYLYMYGQFLFPVVLGGLVSLVYGIQRRDRGWTFDDLLWPTVVVMAVGVLMVLLIGYFEVAIAWLVVPLGGLATLVLSLRTTSVRRRLLWFFVGTALALSLLVEVAVLKGDIGRMNTVFKFHLQVWMLLGISAAVFVERLVYVFTNAPVRSATSSEASLQPAVSPPTHMPVTAVAEAMGDHEVLESNEGHVDHRRWPLWITRASPFGFVAVTLLVFMAALYPTFAIPARLRDRWVPSAPHTLDGMAYIPYATQFEQDSGIGLDADYRVIRWLQENVKGSPTIMEAQAEREYLWGNRISIYTGLPSVVGWRWHQVQQRMEMPPGTVEARQQDVRTFYNTTDAGRAFDILKAYHVEYVILTPYERVYMAPGGAGKFAEMVARGWLQVVYHDESSTIYQVQY